MINQPATRENRLENSIITSEWSVPLSTWCSWSARTHLLRWWHNHYGSFRHRRRIAWEIQRVGQRNPLCFAGDVHETREREKERIGNMRLVRPGKHLHTSSVCSYVVMIANIFTHQIEAIAGEDDDELWNKGKWKRRSQETSRISV